MKRRTFLTGSATAAVTLSANAAFPQSPPAAGQPLSPSDVASAVPRLRAQFAQDFGPEYFENVIVPYFLVSTYEGEEQMLPMIGVALTKENALPYDLWGLLSETWQPAPQHGVTVFLQGLDKRGPDNRRKRIYMSAVTPDLYRAKYADKVTAFFDKLMSQENAGKPLMRPYLEAYWDLYWDLHLGVSHAQVPNRIRQIGNSFNTVLAYRDPTQRIVYENYMTVHDNLGYLKGWIDEKISDMKAGKIENPEKTFAWYWIKNAGDGEYFAPKDVVFECFHNFVAFSQWGNTLYNIMRKLGTGTGDPEARAWFAKTMESDFDSANGAPFTPLERFTMELFRTISPNGGSISALTETRPPYFERHGYIVTPHTSTSMDPVHWKNPTAFDPSRYEHEPTSQDINEAKALALGFAKCPFDKTSFELKDGRNGSMENSAFGTVFGEVDNKPLPVCDYAGFAPFGFGYRRCPGEQLTILAFSDFLKKAWNDKLEFVQLDLSDPEPLPIGPTTVIGDNMGFVRAT